MIEVKKNDDVIISVRITNTDRILLSMMKEYNKDYRLSTILRRALNLYFNTYVGEVKLSILNYYRNRDYKIPTRLAKYDKTFDLEEIKRLVNEKFK